MEVEEVIFARYSGSPSASHCKIAAGDWRQISRDGNLNLDWKATETHLIRQVDIEGRGKQAVQDLKLCQNAVLVGRRKTHDCGYPKHFVTLVRFCVQDRDVVVVIIRFRVFPV